MPYIKSEYRTELDQQIDTFYSLLEPIFRARGFTVDPQTYDGVTNYIITRLLQRLYPANRYQDMARASMTLEQVKAEWQRRRIEPYEEKMKEQNGDCY